MLIELIIPYLIVYFTDYIHFFVKKSIEDSL